MQRTRRTEVDDELDDLQTGDPFLPPTAHTTGALEVVPVHDHVDEQVQRDDDPGHSGATEELCVAQNSGSAMVVAVEESWKDDGLVHWSSNCVNKCLVGNVLRGFFLRNKKTVSSSSRYLVR